MKKSRWKLPYIHSSFFKKRKIFSTKTLGLSNFRNSTIPATFCGRRCYIHNGAWALTTKIEENMIGFKVGDFSITKKFNGQRGLKRKTHKRSKKHKK